MRILFLLIPILLIIGCGNNQPGQTMRLDKAQPVTLEGETLAAVSIENGQTLVTAKGRTCLMALGNSSTETIKLNITGAVPAGHELPPLSWTHIRVETLEEKQVLQWSGASLHMAEPYLLPGKPETMGPNILLISVDTLRYDYFSKETMPGLTEIFAGGRVYNNIRTPAPWTLPAHASLFTSLYPAAHGVRKHGHKLSGEPLTLAESFRDMGYRTLAVTEGNYVSATFGLSRGFHRFEENPPAMMENDPASASRLESSIQRLEAQLNDNEGAPLFAFLHTYEVHCPFLPRYELQDPFGYGSTKWLLDNDGKIDDPGIYATIEALYWEEVVYTDKLLAPLVNKLLESGNWIIALTSDHGEEFGEHGGLLHADNLYEEAAHVPLALIGKGITPHQGPIDRPGSLVDVPSTLLALAGQKIPTSWQGQDLTDPGYVIRPVFAESFFFGAQIPAKDPRVAGVWKDGLKLTQTRNFDTITAELFDLERDPDEKNNLLETRVEERDALYLLIEAYFNTAGLQGEAVGELTPEQLELMRSLGYIK